MQQGAAEDDKNSIYKIKNFSMLYETTKLTAVFVGVRNEKYPGPKEKTLKFTLKKQRP